MPKAEWSRHQDIFWRSIAPVATMPARIGNHRRTFYEGIPLLVQHLHGEDTQLIAECCCALRRIGGDAVVERIAGQWRNAGSEFRAWATGVLDVIHSDSCVQRCREFLAQEGDREMQLALGHCLLSHFASEGIAPVRRMLLEADDHDLKRMLVLAATIMGTRFPEYAGWYAEAMEDNGGCEKCGHKARRDIPIRRKTHERMAVHSPNLCTGCLELEGAAAGS
jgi:hypothetical protein